MTKTVTMATLTTRRGLSWVSCNIPSLSHTVWYRCRFKYLYCFPDDKWGGSSIGGSVTHCFHDTTSSNVEETIHTSWDIQFLLSKVTSDINICYQMSSTVILPNFNFANEEFSVNVIIYICWHWHWIPSVISCLPHIHIYFFHLLECGMSFIFILWF